MRPAVRIGAAAEAVLKGERHPKLGKDVKFFHQAGLTFPYTNMHYVHVAGGNAFYEKRRGARRAAPVQIARAKPDYRLVQAVQWSKQQSSAGPF